MANETYSSGLAALQQDVLADLIYKGLNNRHPGLDLATRHDLGNVAAGTTVKFPVIPAFTATELAENVATTYTTISPTAATATAFELQVGVKISNFAEVTSSIKNVERFGDQMTAAMIDKLEAKLLAEIATGATETVGALTSSPATLAKLTQARGKLGANASEIAGWVVNGAMDAAVIADSGVANAAAFGANVLKDGALASMYGAPYAVSGNLPTGTSLLVGSNTAHYAVLQAPRMIVQEDPDTRLHKVVMVGVFAVKYLPVGDNMSVEILNS